ncbi:peroxiredoxin [Sphingomonas cannabina]|uniref:peroxiredoxin n=1 Tax=Sphingomonas cannabina TaxID=2899123 RepID=UPI001F328252|nr:peroxiredoxin [Sphingomonas cannabina]UIJ47025.1 peroxiredoxin [Sphingomonas cannabina]
MAIEGERLPDHELTGSDGAPLRLAGFVGKPLVLYFYPKDDTTGCTREAQDFTALMPEFEAAGVQVLGVSKDTPASHVKFTKKYDLTVPLASDADGALIEALGAWVEKSMYGRRFMGIERSTFLFRADGTLARAWRKVKVAGHAAEVLAAARAL